MKKLNNGNTDNQQDLSFLTEEQKALQSIYADLREMEIQKPITRFFDKVKSMFIKDSVGR